MLGCTIPGICSVDLIAPHRCWDMASRGRSPDAKFALGLYIKGHALSLSGGLSLEVSGGLSLLFPPLLFL